MNPRVLVAATAFAGKRYALDRYLAAYEALDYPEKHLLVVDNTKGSEAYADLVRSRGVEVIHHEPGATLHEALVTSWQHITLYAWEHGYPLVLSLEQDVIVPPHALSKMVELYQDRDLLMLRHVYPSRESVARVPGAPSQLADFGCTLMSTNLLCQWAVGDTSGLFIRLGQMAGARDGKVWRFEIEHLDGGDADYNQWPEEGGDRRQGFVTLDGEVVMSPARMPNPGPTTP